MSDEKKAVVLLSGGLDSTTCVAIARDMGFDIYALAVYYKQRHEFEMKASQRVADFFGVKKFVQTNIDLRMFGGSALTSEVDVPKSERVEDIGTDIPVTYVPARNTVFLSLALAWAEALGAGDIFIGVNALDYSGYPDCRPEFIEAFERTANLATKAGVEGKVKIKIHTPLIHMTKTEIVKRGVELGVDYSITHTCYDPAPDGAACGHCDACLLRLKGFAEAGLKDPTPYQPGAVSGS